MRKEEEGQQFSSGHGTVRAATTLSLDGRTTGFIPWAVHTIIVAREASQISYDEIYTSTNPQIHRINLSSKTARVVTGSPRCLLYMGRSRVQGRSQSRPRAYRC
jgi:hypothetical protein